MSNITNWKYKKWQSEMLFESKDIEDYISYEIYPEDIEIFSAVLLPHTFEYKGYILMCITGSNDEHYFRKMFDDSTLPLIRRQAGINCLNLTEGIFFNKRETSDQTMVNVAKLIKHNWEYHLAKKYPDRNFIVEISSAYLDPLEVYVTFYEVEDESQRIECIRLDEIF